MLYILGNGDAWVSGSRIRGPVTQMLASLGEMDLVLEHLRSNELWLGTILYHHNVTRWWFSQCRALTIVFVQYLELLRSMVQIQILKDDGYKNIRYSL